MPRTIKDMDIARNVGGLDRLFRGVVAVVAAVVAAWTLLHGWVLVGAAALAVAGNLGFNAVTGFCGINAMLGIDTCKR